MVPRAASTLVPREGNGTDWAVGIDWAVEGEGVTKFLTVRNLIWGDPGEGKTAEKMNLEFSFRGRKALYRWPIPARKLIRENPELETAPLGLKKS